MRDEHTPDPKGFIRSRGLRVPKHPDITRGPVRGALREGTYERKECDAALKVVQDGDRVLELGGGIGYMSTLLSVKKNLDCIVSYEANPHLAPYINALHAANNVQRAELRTALLSDGPGDPVEFYVRRNFLGSSLDRASDPASIIDTVLIDRHPIADTLAEVRPDVLICDIEGAEADLLPAADWTGLRAAIIELHPQWIGQKGVQAVFDTMHAAGLSYWPKGSEAKVVTFRKSW